MLYVRINGKEFGKKEGKPTLTFKDGKNELQISDLESAVEEASNILYVLENNRTSEMIQELLVASGIEDYMKKIGAFDSRIKEVKFSEEEKKLHISTDQIVIPINSKSAGYLGHILINGDIDVELALQFIASINSITSIIEGSILAKRSFEMLKSSLETLSKAMESRAKEAEKFKEVKYGLFNVLIDQFDVDQEVAELAFYVYDVGLIGVKDYILQKGFSELTSQELEEYKKHPLYGYEILKNIQNLPKEVLDATLYHHERLDGSGFPQGLKGKDIPYIALFIGFIDEVARLHASGLNEREIEGRISGKFPEEFVRRLREVPIDA